MALVEAARFYFYPEAEIARGRLEADGIAGIVFDGAMSAYTAGGLIPVRLMVDADDLARAREALGGNAW